MVKNWGFYGKMTVFLSLWMEIEVLMEKWWVFQKMGVSWVFGQKIGENQGRAGNLRIS